MFVSADMKHVHLAYFSSMLSTYVMYPYPSVRVHVLSQESVLIDPCSLHIYVQRVYYHSARVSLTLNQQHQTNLKMSALPKRARQAIMQRYDSVCLSRVADKLN
jgi:hypothetical protein